MNQKNQRGITLIALIVTIIILLILAGITINMTLGNDGIIGQAEKAKKIYEEKAADEDLKIASGELELSQYIDTVMTFDEVKEWFPVEGVQITYKSGEKKTITRYDEAFGLQYKNNIKEIKEMTVNGKTVNVPIPVGFALLQSEQFSDGCYAIDSYKNIYKWFPTTKVGASNYYLEEGDTNAIPYAVNYGGIWSICEIKKERNSGADDVWAHDFCLGHPCPKVATGEHQYIIPGQTHNCEGTITYNTYTCPNCEQALYCSKCHDTGGKVCASCNMPWGGSMGGCYMMCGSTEYVLCTVCEGGVPTCTTCGVEGVLEKECWCAKMKACTECNDNGEVDYCDYCGTGKMWYYAL